jgi:WD40 repeat protein
MSRIFLSHSSKDSSSAVVLRDWLAEQGWDDVFLDLDPRRGIAAGYRWERALNQAALRCEAVLFLVSRAWLASDWCLKEFNLAHRLNKRLFGLLIEDIPVGDLPATLTGTWQLVPLASGRDHVMLRAVLPGSDARIPRERDARLALLRRGLIPWLAGIDPDTGSPRWQKARTSEIPEEARPLINLLVEQRLLSTDKAVDTGDRTIEPAHEALLRQWGSLQGWLQEDFAALMNLEAVKRAARDWAANARSDDWLAHRAGRLEDAQGLLLRPDFAGRFDTVDRDYLNACSVQDAAERRDKAAALERELTLQSQARKRARAFGIGAGIVAVLMTALVALAYGALYVAELQRTAALEAQSKFLAGESRIATDDGDATLGKLLAARALPDKLDTPARPFLADAEASLEYAYEKSREMVLLQGHRQMQVRIPYSNGSMQVENVFTVGSIDYALYSPDGVRIATSSGDGTVRIWNAETGKQTALIETILGRVSHISFLPDGRLLVLTDTRAPEIRDPTSGALLTRLEGGKECLVDVGSNRVSVGGIRVGPDASAASPEGGRIATVSGTKICLWDASGARISVITAPGEKINIAMLSRHGDRLMVANDQGVGALIDANNGKILVDLKQVVGAKFSHNGKLLAIGSLDNSATIRDASDGQVLTTLNGHDGPVRTLDFSPDDLTIATGSDDHTVRLWSAADGSPRMLRRWNSKGPGPAVFEHQNGVKTVSFAGAGTYVLTIAGDYEASLWNVQNGWRKDLTEDGKKISIVRMSDDGSKVVTYSGDHFIRIWDGSSISGNDPPDPIAAMKADGITALTISADGKRLVSGSEDAIARVWTLESKRPPAFRWLDHHQAIWSAQFAKSNFIVATGDGSISVRDPGSGELVRSMKQDGLGEIRQALLGPDDRLLMTLTNWGTMRIWNLSDGKQLVTEGDGDAQAEEAERISKEEERREALRSASSGGAAIQAPADESAQGLEEPLHRRQTPDEVKIVASPDRRFAAALAIRYNDDPHAHFSVGIMDLADGREYFRISGEHGSATAAAFADDGGLFAIGFADGTLTVADIISRRILGEYATGATLKNQSLMSEAVLSVLFSHDGRTVIAGIRDGTVRMLQVVDGRVTKTMTHEIRRGDVKIALSPDGSRIVTAGGVNVKLWTGEGELVANLGTWDGEGRPIFSPDGSRILTSNDPAGLLWDSATGKKIAVLYRNSIYVQLHGFSPDGRYILTTHDSDPNLYLWDGHTGQLLVQLDGIRGDSPSLKAAVSRDGKLAVAGSGNRRGGGNGSVTVWHMPERCQALIDRATASSPRALSDDELARYFLDRAPETGFVRWLAIARTHIPWFFPRPACELENSHPNSLALSMMQP